MPTALEIADAISGRYGVVASRFVYQRRTAAYGFIDAITPAVIADASPTLDLDNDRAVLRSVRGIELLESALPADFDPTRDHIAIVEELLVGAEWVPFPLGLFRLDVGDTRYGKDDQPIIECDAADLGSVTTESGPSVTYVIPQGTGYRAAVIAVLDGLGLSHDLAPVSAVLPTAQMWPAWPETTWQQVLHDLADGINYHDPWPNHRGTFVWAPWPEDPSTVAPATDYRDDVEPRLIDGESDYRRQQDAGRLANRCVVVIDDPTHPAYPVYVMRENADPTSPISSAARPERPLELTWDSAPRSTRCILGTSTAASVAATVLRHEAARYRTATLETLPDPRRGAHEYYRLSLGGVESETLWRVARWSRQLSEGGRHTHELQQVTPVALIDPEAGP